MEIGARGRCYTCHTDTKLAGAIAQAIEAKSKTEVQGSPKPERRKPAKDITAIYTQGISSSTPPASPKVQARERPQKDIRSIYSEKLEPTNGANADSLKPSPKKVRESTTKEDLLHPLSPFLVMFSQLTLISVNFFRTNFAFFFDI